MALTFILLAIGLIFSGHAFFHLIRHRRMFSAGVNGLIAVSFLVLGGLISLLLLNLQTYQQLTKETTLAEIHMGKPTGQGIPLRLTYRDQADTYLIRTAQWRLDARFVKWKSWMTLLGKEPVVRLERLEERGEVADGRTIMNRYDLISNHAWTEGIISSLTEDLGLIDTVFGSSVYMPTAPGAEYRITASMSGLVARPVNKAARRAVMEWSGQ